MNHYILNNIEYNFDIIHNELVIEIHDVQTKMKYKRIIRNSDCIFTNHKIINNIVKLEKILNDGIQNRNTIKLDFEIKETCYVINIDIITIKYESEQMQININCIDINEINKQQYNKIDKTKTIKITKITKISEEIGKNDFKFSKIIYGKINKKKIINTSYRDILYDILSIIDKKYIFTEAKYFNVDENKRNDKGYKYKNDLGFSIQCSDATRVLKGIIHMSIMNKIHIQIKIKLSNDKIIRIIN